MESGQLQKIGIIGGGIIGLSTATILQKRYPNVKIQLTSERLNQYTTSWGAPGFVRLNIDENKYEDTYRWYKKGTKHYWELYRSPDCVRAGISINNLYYISDKEIKFPTTYKDIYEAYREVSSKELASIGFGTNIKYGVSYTSPIVESRYYLQYLAEEFTENGGEIIIDKVNNGKQNVADWALRNAYDVIVNCSGLGAHHLFQDKEIVPLRGQVVRVHAPWLKHSFMTPDSTYAISCRDSVVLGTFRQKNDWDLSIRPNETRDILDRIYHLNVCLSKSPIVEEWTGLRPFRKNLRLEIEHIQSSSGIDIPVVHNYGHGSSGVGLSWGTSLEAADLVDSLTKSSVTAKVSN